MNREQMISSLSSPWDVCIIGGGATGLGIAIDAANRGYRTVLFEKYDFAKGTSSRSTKLVHGGVRYLQQGNIKLVMEALKERGRLLKNAPHIVHNQQFIVPRYKWWEGAFYGIGLKIYDMMAGKLGLGPSQFLSKEETLELVPGLDPTDLRGGIRYHDGQFDDTRLAISMARTAYEQGATLLNYCGVMSLLKTKEKISGVRVHDEIGDKDYEISAKHVINATGIFADDILALDTKDHRPILSLSQGIHLVVDKKFLRGDTAIMIPRTDDGRVLFAVPWHGKVVLGTTDTPVEKVETEPVPKIEEIDFILTHIGRYLTSDPVRKDIQSMFAGLRPLVKGKAKRTAALSRDHLITVSLSGLVTITGGKWTTYRKMAEDVVDLLGERTGRNEKCNTRELVLNGHDHAQLPASIEELNDGQLKELIAYCIKEEMCLTIEDLLARRTRQLLLNASVAIERSETVARIMASILGKDDDWIQTQINNFKAVAKNYLPPL